ncbi:MAG: hypothetical protein K0Q74_1519, partial [Gammaproteobacteria bacterium]|nr:hypothetical protein [Gammaproteobacteria bacterium]
MANERAEQIQEYYLGLTEISSEQLEESKQDNERLLLNKLKVENSNIPTLVKFTGPPHKPEYYLFGLSGKGEEILTPISSSVYEAALTAAKETDKRNLGNGGVRKLTISPRTNPATYRTILSLQQDHSFFPTLIWHHLPALLSAFDSDLETEERNNEIYNAIQELGIDLSEYFKAKGIELSEQAISEFVHNIATHSSLQAPLKLFSHMGVINKLYDDARLQEESSASAVQASASSNIQGIDNCFILAGKVLKGINDQISKANPNPFSQTLLTADMLNAYLTAAVSAEDTQTPLAADTLNGWLSSHSPAAAVIASTETALIIHGKQLLKLIETNANAQNILDAFVTLLANLPQTERNLSELANNLELTLILDGLRKHSEIFKQLR